MIKRHSRNWFDNKILSNNKNYYLPAKFMSLKVWKLLNMPTISKTWIGKMGNSELFKYSLFTFLKS